MSEKRLVEIETKIAFQEKTIKGLNDVLCEQHQAHKRNKGISK
ncbi:MAG: SlyX family protein [Proteobacteria bacterium]|nr:SlyX family protein [Candidatus Omnitrophota bacterium]MBU4288127.1 SlyX family protein [Pseudomonadota bacterium]MBU4504214.1 SlyX family protein [Pseudomonadota bacterium]MCG2831450.1 SlyX family protein [Desulfobacteraceae bacterium]